MKYNDKQSLAWRRREIEKSFNDNIENTSERKARRKFKRDVANFGIKVCANYDRIWWDSLTDTMKENIYRDWTSHCFTSRFKVGGPDLLHFIKKARKENPATENYRDNKLKSIGI